MQEEKKSIVFALCSANIKEFSLFSNQFDPVMMLKLFKTALLLYYIDWIWSQRSFFFRFLLKYAFTYFFLFYYSQKEAKIRLDKKGEEGWFCLRYKFQWKCQNFWNDWILIRRNWYSIQEINKQTLTFLLCRWIFKRNIHADFNHLFVFCL